MHLYARFNTSPKHSIAHHQNAVKLSTIVQICETFHRLHMRHVNENEKLLTKDFVSDGSFVFNHSSLRLFLYKVQDIISEQ
jgi:hypothetical protein